MQYKSPPFCEIAEDLGVPLAVAGMKRLGRCPASRGRSPSGLGCSPRYRLSLPPSARDQAAIRSGSPSSPPNARQTKEKILVIRPLTPRQVAGIARAKAFNAFLLNFSTSQLFFVGAPTRVIDSCNCIHLGCTQEGVAEDRRAKSIKQVSARRAEARGKLPPLRMNLS